MVTPCLRAAIMLIIAFAWLLAWRTIMESPVLVMRNRALTCVGVAGFEPTTSSSRTKRATKLRYTPMTAREV
jgi:hypothetical protein